MSGVVEDASYGSAPRMQCMEVWGGNCMVDRAFEMPGLNTWVYSRPYDDSAGGGDVYYVSSCASGRITRLLLADVSGHGAGVSDVALSLRDLMRKNVNVVRQTRFVEGMNQQFTKLAESGHFATALVATFFQPTRRLTLCNAGHPSPLVYDRSESAWSRVENPSADSEVVVGTPLGVHDQASYPQVEVSLDPGDMVLLFSDALTECYDQDGSMKGQDGLLDEVRRLSPEPPAELLQALIATATLHAPDRKADDDLTAVLLQATGSSTRLTDNVLALFRLMRPVSDNTQLRD